MLDFKLGDPIGATVTENYRKQEGNSVQINCADGTIMVSEIPFVMTSEYFEKMIENAESNRTGPGPVQLDQTAFPKGLVKVRV